jgi:predicted ATPase/signal transduction histidine kinase/tRNA A-37 threonylcarbamoyl transferase component Bud32
MLTLPNYQIRTQIYESANSLVYRGIRKKDNQPVILKVLKEDYPTPEELTRYRQEYEITKSLNFDGVVKTYGMEKYQNTLVIILEDFGGESLKQFLTKRPFLIKEFLLLAILISDSLSKIHTANIIHKDINPANIVWNKKTNQLKIIDFGIASRLPRENPVLKNPEQLEGTLAYISPEQTGRMNRSLDYRTDLYSLGVTFYELLTGKQTFESDSAMELVHYHIAKTPKPVSETNPNVPSIISNIVMKLIAKNVEDRYQSAFGVQSDLQKVQENLTGLQYLSGLQFELAQNDFSGKLQIPQKLYGRENEINTLLQAFERVSEGAAEMMLVAGYSGVGKTALVNEVHKPMTSRNGYFAAGKFDQFQKNIPYSAITQAFNEFCRYLLMENAKILANWQTKLLAAVGNNGKIIIDVIPDLELVIGKQPTVAEVGPTEAQNRFQRFFLNFVKALCKENHPLILFIDDLQWVDSASLTLLKTIMFDKEIKHLLIIGAYRDNIVNSSHPFVMAISELQKANAIINTICLPNLQMVDINKLLQESLNCEAEQTQSLTDLIYQKTQGNAFFTHQFLQTLYREGLLRFDFAQLKWQWAVEQIAAQNITANVVELMASKIGKLPAKTSKVLQLAACIGNQFNLSLLAIIYEQNQNETLSILWDALVEGLIHPLDENYKHFDTFAKAQFKFLHDRVQQAAYALIDEVQKKTIHIKIGQLLLAKGSENEVTENLFNIANQFNKGLDLIKKDKDKLVLAEINLNASQKARQAMASQPALEYVKKAMFLLPTNPWQKEYQLTVKLYKERAEAEFVNAHYKEAIKFIEQVIKFAKTVSEQMDGYYLLITIHSVKGDFDKAIETGRTALSLFGIILPNDTEKERVSLDEIAQARENLRGIKPDSILSWKDLTEPKSILLIKLMVVLESSVYIIGDLSMYIYLVSRSVNISVQHKGLVVEIAKMYANYGFLIGDIYGDYGSSYAFGTLALNIAERYNSGAYICKTSILLGNWINPWCQPFYQAADIHIKGYQAGIESGEYEFAGYNVYGYFNNLVTQGQNLSKIKTEIKLYWPLIEKINHQLGAYFLLGMAYFVNFLQDEETTLAVFGQKMSLKQMLMIAEENNMSMLLCSYYVNMSFAHYLLGELKEAVLQIEKAKKHLNGVFGSTTYSAFFFQQALVSTALLPNIDIQEKPKCQAKIEDSFEKLSAWATKCCAANFEHQFLLLQAEIRRANGNSDLEIMRLYDQAITSAKENGFIQNEALANELAAQFWLEQNKEEIAHIYLKKAHYRYQQWGAIAKVKDLEKRYPQWLAKKSALSMPTSFTNTTSTATILATRTRTCMSQWLDLDSVMKASQTLSGEIMLSRLLSKMMHIVIENAGAERGFLILPQDDKWVIEAEGALDKTEVTVLHSLPVSHYLPEAIISYVARTQENVVLTDARREGLYTDNPYIKAHQTQSVLCFPVVYQQQLRTILYLENNLTTGAFTETRLKMLKMLSSQIAISLENAQVMAHLDSKVKERTAQLNAKVEELTQTRQELVQSEKMASLGRLVAGFAHELNTPLGVAVGAASTLQNNVININQLIEQDEVDEEELLSDLDTIDQTAKLTLSNLTRAADLVTSFKRTAVDQTSDKIRIFDVKQLIEDIIKTLHNRFKQTDINISLDCPTNLTVESLPGTLEQILTNLLMNSLIHGFNEGQNAGAINIKAQLDGDNLHLEYSDNGKGIAQENLEKIFEPFFTTHRAHGGSGLGMYICYNLITTQLQGTITCESQPGEGVVFQIDYPISP